VEKIVYVVRGAPGDGSEDLVKDVGPAVLAAGGRHVTVHAIDHDDDGRYRAASGVDVGTSAGGAVVVRGAVSFWIDSIDDVGPLAAIVHDGRTAHGYLVTESVPRRQARTWPIGEPTPGVSMVTVLDKPAHVSHDEFLHKWTTAHTPLSLAWLPLVGYVRNHVVRPLDADAPAAAGIVTEHFAELDDVLDPERFLSAVGRPELVAERQAAMTADVVDFLDLERVETHLMQEVMLD
jgi:hypothetical protein